MVELLLYALITSLRRKWPPSPPSFLQHRHPSPPLPPSCRTSTLTMAAPPSPHPALASRAQSAFVRRRIREGSKVFFLKCCLLSFCPTLFQKIDSLSGWFAASFDPDIRVVLELASDSELYDIESILFGPRCVPIM